jgi:argininosuccinate lyase
MNNKKAQEFISSYSFDMRLAEFDIIGSMAHVNMLAKCRIIPKKDAGKIIKGLKSMLSDLGKGKKIPKQEDVHYAVEKELIRRIGPVGGKMHTARSRNDQVALDMRMYAKHEILCINDLLAGLQEAVLAQASRNINVVMPGYTHLQPAQPVLFSHYVLSYAWMFERDKERMSDCFKRADVMPLGSAAFAGTSFPVDRKYAAGLLNFKMVSENSIDSVSDRDFLVEFLSCISIVSAHLSRLAEELVIFSSAEFDFVRMADEFTSGSSIMPQKRNPDVAEIIRGKTGRVYGDLISMLTILKGLPLSYNRDLQEDKPPVFDAVDTLKACLEVMIALISTIKVKPGNMLASTKKGFITATEIADYLAQKGVPFRLAHQKTKDIVNYCVKHNKELKDLTGSELKKFSHLFGKDIKNCLDPVKVVNVKNSQGGTSPGRVKEQIRKLKKLI